MHYLDKRHDEFFGIVGLVHIPHNAFPDFCRRAVSRGDSGYRAVVAVAEIIERRYINAIYFRGFTQKIPLAAALFLEFLIKVDHLKVNLLALAYKEEVNKIGYRLGVAAAGTARHYYR